MPIHPRPFIFYLLTNRQVTNKEMREISVLLRCSISCPALVNVPLLWVCTRMRGGEMEWGGSQIKVCVEVGGIWSRFSFKPSEKSFCNQGDSISGDREKGQRIHVAKETRRSWHSYINFHLYWGRKRKLSEVSVDTLVTDWNWHFFTVCFGITWLKTLNNIQTLKYYSSQ